jgi:hypothetical protein
MAKPRRNDRRILSVRLPVALIERLKRVAKDGAGRPLYLTLAGVVEAALNTELDRVEQVLDATIVDPTLQPVHSQPQTRRDTMINNSVTNDTARRRTT